MYKWELIFHISVVYLWGRISSMEPHAYIWEPRILTTWHISFQRMLRKWGRHCYSINFSIVFLWSPSIPIHTPSTCHWSGNSSRDMTIMQFHKLVISEITFLTLKNSVLILHPPSIQHISQPCCAPLSVSQPLLCSFFCFAAPVVLLFLFRSPCCAPLSVSQPLLCCILEPLLCSSFWNPCCVPVDLTGVSLPAKFASNKY